jgi:hypothetical protein
LKINILIIFIVSILFIHGCATTKFVCSDGLTVTDPSDCQLTSGTTKPPVENLKDANIPNQTEVNTIDTQNKNEAEKNKSTPNTKKTLEETTVDVEFVGNFNIQSDDENLKVYFSLTDKNKNYVAQDGVADLRIVNSEKEELYNKPISVTKDGFGSYTIRLTGKSFLAYEWKIPIKEIKKSISSSGKAFLKFSSLGASFEELETSIFDLPVYAEDELKEINEKKYQNEAIKFEKRISKGDWDITITEFGFFNPLVQWGEEKEYFRVDLKVKCRAKEKEYFSPSGMVILDAQGNQYEKEYGGTLDTFSQMYPGVTKEGYVLFEKLPKTTTSAKMMFSAGYDDDYDEIEYEFQLPLASIES